MKRKEKLQEIFNFTNDEVDFLLNESPRDLTTKIIEKCTQLNEKFLQTDKTIKSPYLKKSTQLIEFKGFVNRDAVVLGEFGQHIDETEGTMFFFKEKTKEFAQIAGLDPDEMRMAFTEGIQNVLEHGEGDNVEISVRVNNINSDNVYLEMSFKHYMSDKNFYSLTEANKSADSGMMDFESPRGRGEFMMREIMDERKFINGYEKDDSGKGLYFFQRILRKYLNSKPKKDSSQLTNDFKTYIDSLQDYGSALFVRMDYYAKKKELVISEQKGDIESITKLLNAHSYSYKGRDHYKNIYYTFWEKDLTEEDTIYGFDSLINDLRMILTK